MLINSTVSTATLSLFSRAERNQDQAAKIVQILSAGERGQPTPDTSAQGYTVGSSEKAVLDGVYTDPRLSVAKADDVYSSTRRTLDALNSIRNNEFRDIEASYQNAVEQEIGKKLGSGERLSLEDSQSLSTGLQRAESKINLLRLKLDIASGNIGQGQSIDVDWGDQTPPNLVTGPNASAESIATFRSMQVQSLVNMSQDGTFERLAGEIGGTVNNVTGAIPSLTNDEMATMKAEFLREQIRKG